MTYKKNNNQKYNKFSSNSNKSFQQFISQPIGFENSNVLEPVMNTDGLFKLANFVESNKTEVGFPEVTVIPDLLRSVGKFVNERKRMKYAHQEFEKKLKFISDGVDKQYHVAMSRIESDTEIKLAQIKGNLHQSIMNINRYYDTEIQRIASAYKLKIKEMDLYYKNLEAQRKEQNKRFDKMMKLAMIDRKKASKAISEAEQVCQFYQTKMYAGTISKKEMKFYMDLLRLRINGVTTIVNIIPMLASKIH